MSRSSAFDPVLTEQELVWPHAERLGHPEGDDSGPDLPDPRRPASARWRGLASAHYFWVIPGVVMALVGRFHAAAPHLWRDEIATWSAATRTVPELMLLLRHTDAVSGAYYLFMHYWIAVFGDTNVAMRIPSILAMAGAAVFTALTGERLWGKAVGLTAGLVFAVIPSISRFAQEARAYGFVTLAAALATFLLVRALAQPRWTRWLPYSAVFVLLGYAHVIGMLLLSGHGLAVGWRAWKQRDRRLLRGWAVAAAIAVVVVAPLLYLASKQRVVQIGWMAAPTFGEMPMMATVIVHSSLMTGALIVLSVLALRQPGPGLALVAGGVVVPLVLLFAFSQVTPVFWPRYLLFLLPGVALLVGRALTGFRPAAAVGIALLLGGLGFPDQMAVRTFDGHEQHLYPNATWYPSPNWPKAADLIMAEKRPGDGIVYVGDSVTERSYFMQRSTMDYYLRHEPDRPRDVQLARTGAAIGQFWAVECEPAGCLPEAPRLWLVSIYAQDSLLAEPDDLGVIALKRDYTSVRIWNPPGITVELLQRKG